MPAAKSRIDCRRHPRPPRVPGHDERIVARVEENSRTIACHQCRPWSGSSVGCERGIGSPQVDAHGSACAWRVLRAARAACRDQPAAAPQDLQIVRHAQRQPVARARVQRNRIDPRSCSSSSAGAGAGSEVGDHGPGRLPEAARRARRRRRGTAARQKSRAAQNYRRLFMITSTSRRAPRSRERAGPGSRTDARVLRSPWC